MLKYGFIFVYIQNGDTEMNFSLGESFSGSDYFQVSIFKLMFFKKYFSWDCVLNAAFIVTNFFEIFWETTCSASSVKSENLYWIIVWLTGKLAE